MENAAAATTNEKTPQDDLDLKTEKVLADQANAGKAGADKSGTDQADAGKASSSSGGSPKKKVKTQKERKKPDGTVPEIKEKEPETGGKGKDVHPRFKSIAVGEEMPVWYY